MRKGKREREPAIIEPVRTLLLLLIIIASLSYAVLCQAHDGFVGCDLPVGPHSLSKPLHVLYIPCITDTWERLGGWGTV